MDIKEFLKPIIDWITEPLHLSIILCALVLVFLILLILVVILMVKVHKAKKDILSCLFDGEIDHGLSKFDETHECECCKDEKCSCNDSKVTAAETAEIKTEVTLEPDVTAVTVNGAPREFRFKRETTGVMKFTHKELAEIAKTLGVVDSWKNKTEIVKVIKTVLESNKCTKKQILGVFGLPFIKSYMKDSIDITWTKAKCLEILKEILRR